MLYEILKTSKLGASFAPDMYTALWAQKLARDGEVKTLSGAPPLSFQANGTPLLDYLISGNIIQSGTPTPDNPVMPQGTGERTGNLVAAEVNHTTSIGGLSAVWEKDSSEMIINGKATSGDSYRFATIELNAGTYTLSITGLDETGWSKTGFYLSGVDTVRVQGVRTYTITEPTIARLQFVAQTSDISYENRKVTIMFTKTSAALPYEPYGYKIPISSAGQTTPIYLGEVEITRRIKRLVLTGEENYSLQSINDYGIANFYFYIMTRMQTAICTHLKRQTTIISQTTDEGYLIALPSQSSQNASFYIRISSSTASTVAELKSYLAQQYAAGTPVTVWYVLAESEVGVVNEPLMKIGEYADSISKAQTGVEIPTTRGTNTLDVLTDVKPSEIYIKYKS